MDPQSTFTVLIEMLLSKQFQFCFSKPVLLTPLISLTFLPSKILLHVSPVPRPSVFGTRLMHCLAVASIPSVRSHLVDPSSARQDQHLNILCQFLSPPGTHSLTHTCAHMHTCSHSDAHVYTHLLRYFNTLL